MGIYNPNFHHRKSIRLPGYDYASANAYFVTICAYKREAIFGEIGNGIMKLNDIGMIISEIWDELPRRFPTIELDTSIIMPNHFHGILKICDPKTDSPVGAQFIAPLRSTEKSIQSPVESEGVINHAPTLGNIIRYFKAKSMYVIHKNGYSNIAWQRNYYEHIIRNDFDLNRIRQYIIDNPIKWDLDPENTTNIKEPII